MPNRAVGAAAAAIPRAWRPASSAATQPRTARPFCAAAVGDRRLPYDGEFDGKVLVVTGGAVGIGRAICERWAEAGGTAVCGDTDAAAGKELESATAGDDIPGSVVFHEFDAGYPTACKELIARATGSLGRLDALCNNVGVQADDGTPAHELPLDVWHRVIAVNLTSYFACAKYALTHWVESERRGAIVNMASVQGLQSQPGIPAYASSKGAILSLTRQLAVQYAAQGIRVNSICPGTINTPLVRNILESRGWPLEEAAKPYPMARIGEPSEVAEAVMFLASHERAGFITGDSLCVDGGIMAVGSWAANA